MLIVALTGRPGAGKDSVGAIMAAAGWHACAFADALRVEVCAVWRGLDWRLLTDRRLKEVATPQLAASHADHADWLRWCVSHHISLHAPRSPRWALQTWGSYRRSQRDDYWIRQLRVPIQVEQLRATAAGRPARIVVTDLRMDNEAAALRALGAHIVRVHRTDLPPLEADTAAHESEAQAAQISADAEIHNDGTLTDLPAEVWRVVGPWLHEAATTQPATP